MASSSQVAFASPSSSDPCRKYDVFLSFRDLDTRKGITVDIYDGLNRRGIKTFMDDPDLKVGDVISPTLLEAIKKSSFGDAFTWHVNSRRHKSKKVKQWRDALNKIANFSGGTPKNIRLTKNLLTKVVSDAIESTGDFEVFEVTRRAMYEVMKVFTDDEVTAIGVYGIGGVGKTTLVKLVAAVGFLIM